MVRLKNIQITLPARDVPAAAKFYVDVLGFRCESESAQQAVLARGDFRLGLVVADPGAVSNPQSVQLRFTLADPKQVNEMVDRIKRLNLTVLEDVHEQPGGSLAFSCLGPDEHILEIVTEPIQSQPAQTVSEARPPQPTPQTSTSTPSPPAQSAPPTSRPTRADRYALESQDLLARIKEEVAGLTTSFSQTDIAGTLDEMRQKVSQRATEIAEKVMAPAEPDADREQRKKDAQEALARYKQVMTDEYNDLPTPAPPAKPEETEQNLKPVRKTLGPAPDEKPPHQ